MCLRNVSGAFNTQQNDNTLNANQSDNWHNRAQVQAVHYIAHPSAEHSRPNNAASGRYAQVARILELPPDQESWLRTTQNS